jgi:hypothetical protein
MQVGFVGVEIEVSVSQRKVQGSYQKEERGMKRILAILFVIALAFTMISGCADMKTCKSYADKAAQSADQCAALEKKCAADAQAAANSARQAADSAAKAEAMANKCESIFMKHMKK